MKQTSIVSHTSEDRSFVEAKINEEMKIESRRDLFYQSDMYSDDSRLHVCSEIDSLYFINEWTEIIVNWIWGILRAYWINA